MIDIKKLNDEELVSLCEIVSYQAVKNSFKKFPKGYNQLSMVVPVLVTKLTEENIRKIVLKNKSNKFIFDTFSALVNPIFMKINHLVSDSVASGENRIIAISKALGESPFCDNIDLYFKIFPAETDSENISLVKTIVELLKKSADSDDLSEHNSTLNEEITDLKLRISERDSQINELKMELKSVSEKKNAAEKSASELKTSLEFANSKLEKFKTVYENSVVPISTKFEKNPDFEFSSVCKVVQTQYNEKRLYRLADINESGEIVKFVQSDGPKIFFNRDLLYMQDYDKTPDDTVAIWDWKAVPRDNDPDRDYITSSLRIKFKPILRIKEVFPTDEFKSALENGVNVPNGFSEFMFAVRNQNDYFGIVISNGEYTISNGLLKISPDVVRLPKYKITLFDFVEIDNEIYYKFLDLRNFVGYEQIKNSILTVKNIIVSRATRKAFSEYGYSSREWSGAKEFLDEIPTDKLLDEITVKCKCSAREAEEYLEDFISHANDFLTGNSDENLALLNAINSSPELFNKCTEIVKSNWKLENSEKILEANKKLTEISTEVENCQNELTRVNKVISEREKLAGDVEKKVAEKIHAARNDAAGFISEMVFVQPFANISSNTQKPSCIIKSGENIDNLKCEDAKMFEEWLEICCDNLALFGVDELSYNLSAFMYVACESRIPLIISGPCARKIVDAFSFSRYGKTAAYVNCGGEFSFDVIETITRLPDKIVVIDNALSINWVNQIMDLLSAPTKFYVLVQPFAEDLLIEPKGILNYAIPVLTELLIDMIPVSGSYVEPQYSDDFTFPGINSDVKYSNKYLRKLSVNPVVEDKIRLILGNMKTILREDNIAAELILGTIPTAYILSQIDAIKNAISNENLTANMMKLLKTFLGANNDDTISIT